jgi:hypothetical protein
LNNNPYTALQVINHFRLVKFIYFGFLSARVQAGEYNGEVEPTIIIELTTSDTKSKVIREIVKLCWVFTQECIPVSSTEFSELVYHPSYTGEKFSFDPQYFINI